MDNGPDIEGGHHAKRARCDAEGTGYGIRSCRSRSAPRVLALLLLGWHCNCAGKWPLFGRVGGWASGCICRICKTRLHIENGKAAGYHERATIRIDIEEATVEMIAAPGENRE